MKRKILISVLAVLAIAVMGISGCPNSNVSDSDDIYRSDEAYDPDQTGCVKLDDSIAIVPGAGDCCKGLYPQAPEGWTGASWCLKPSCEVECRNKASGEGYALYDSCNDAVLSESSKGSCN